MEYSDLLVLKKDSGFVGTGWYRYLETYYKEEVKHVLVDSMIT